MPRVGIPILERQDTDRHEAVRVMLTWISSHGLREPSGWVSVYLRVARVDAACSSCEKMSCMCAPTCNNSLLMTLLGFVFLSISIA